MVMFSGCSWLQVVHWGGGRSCVGLGADACLPRCLAHSVLLPPPAPPPHPFPPVQVYQYPIRIPERYSLVIRSLLTQEGICMSIKPEFQFLEVAYPYVAR